MISRMLGCSLLVVCVWVVGIQAQEKKETDPIVGKVKEVDAKKALFVITLKDGKDRTFLVNKETKFLGPQGGVSKLALKDDRMEPGYEVQVTASEDGKTAVQVKLPLRKKKS